VDTAANTMLNCSQTCSGRGDEFFEGEPRQECAVEREASWGIAKLRVDWGRAINVCEAAGGSSNGDRSQKELECILSEATCIFSM